MDIKREKTVKSMRLDELTPGSIFTPLDNHAKLCMVLAEKDTHLGTRVVVLEEGFNSVFKTMTMHSTDKVIPYLCSELIVKERK